MPRGIRQLSPLLLLLATGTGCLARALVVTEALPEGAREVRDVAYRQGPDFDDGKHRLNLFIPAGPGPYPVIVFAHGGGWFFGDRIEFTDPYTNLGRRFAERGILTAVISYRLSPEHKHPAHIEDVASAVAWTFANIHAYGGDPSRIHLMGHSAGAHLVALAACDPQWLGRHGLLPSQLAGVVPISGPYDVHHMAQSLILEMVMVAPAFGTDSATWRAVSPVHQPRRAVPPRFLVAWADTDPEIVHRQTRWFIETLRQHRAAIETFEAPFRGHVSIVTELGDSGDALGDVIEAFVKERGSANQQARVEP